jgi:Protein of unknown function (DUF2985)
MVVNDDIDGNVECCSTGCCTYQDDDKNCHCTIRSCNSNSSIHTSRRTTTTMASTVSQSSLFDIQQLSEQQQQQQQSSLQRHDIPNHHITNDDEDDNRNDNNNNSCCYTIDPPRSTMERYRDTILQLLDTSFVQYLGALVLFGVIVDGAIFFFFLMGWQTLCHIPQRTNCEPRNTIYNISIQILNGFFTYMAICALPWRVSNLVHLSNNNHNNWCICCCGIPHRSHEIGRNLYGVHDTDIWFHIPISRRYGITILLLCNCLFQFINHGTRIVYVTYETQARHPGNVWTNVFFASAFLTAGIAALWILYETTRLRNQYPNQFGNGPIDTIRHWIQDQTLYKRYVQPLPRRRATKGKERPTKTNDVTPASNENQNDDDDDDDEVIDPVHEDKNDRERAQDTLTTDHPPSTTTTTTTTLPCEKDDNPAPSIGRTKNDTIVPDPTRATNQPTILLDDRGAIRMFGM